MADIYIDDNETIYVYDTVRGDGLSGGSKVSLLTGLGDYPELSGQSTLFLNHVRFKATGFIDPDGTDFDETQAFCLGGIVPSDKFTIATAPNTLQEYQDLKGFPLKGCFGNSAMMRPRSVAQSGQDEKYWQGVGSTFSFTRTYSPRKALILSRMQSICFTLTNQRSTGSDINYFLSAELQFKRGD